MDGSKRVRRDAAVAAWRRRHPRDWRDRYAEQVEARRRANLDRIARVAAASRLRWR